MNKTVILYSTGCPKCTELKLLLSNHNVSYEERDSIDEMIALGFTKVPMLKIPGDYYLDFSAAKKWLSGSKKDEEV